MRKLRSLATTNPRRQRILSRASAWWWMFRKAARPRSRIRSKWALHRTNNLAGLGGDRCLGRGRFAIRLQHLGHLADLHDAAVLQPHAAVAQAFQSIQRMRNAQDRFSGMPEFH